MIFYARIHGEMIQIICEPPVIIIKNLESVFQIYED